MWTQTGAPLNIKTSTISLAQLFTHTYAIADQDKQRTSMLHVVRACIAVGAAAACCGARLPWLHPLPNPHGSADPPTSSDDS